MNSINTNSKPLIGTRNQWGVSALVVFLILTLSVMARGCDSDNETPMFISKEVSK